MKVLIVEDDPFLSDLVSQKLTKEGYEIFVANNGVDGLKVAAEKIPDLILLDLIMPVLGGFEVLKKIKENPSLRDISVIIFSNLGHKEYDIMEGKRLGAEDFLIKSQMTLKEVAEKIKAVFQKKGLIS